MKHAFTFGLLLLLPFAGVLASDATEFKIVALDVFMQNQIEGTYPIMIPVPAEYDAAQLVAAPASYSYWMRPKDARKANRNRNLTATNGFMYGKISLDVGYDRAKDTFLGAEDVEYRTELANQFSNLQMERTHVGEHAILLMRMTEKTSGTHVYAMYIATNIETNVIYVGYRPANNLKRIGDLFWKRAKQEAERSDMALQNVPNPGTGPDSLAGTLVDDVYTSPSGAFSCQVPYLGSALILTDEHVSSEETVTMGVRDSWLRRVDYLAVGGNPLAWWAGRDNEKKYLSDTMQRLVELALTPSFKKVEIIEQSEKVIDGRNAHYAIVLLDNRLAKEKRGFLVFIHGDHVVILHVRLGRGKGSIDRIYPEMVQFYNSCKFQ